MLLRYDEVVAEMSPEERRQYEFLRCAATSGHKTAGEVLEEWEKEYIAALLAGALE